MGDSKSYVTRIDIEKSEPSDKPFKIVVLSISDKDGKKIYFKNSTEFLNFMSEKRYEMVDQSKEEYHTDYTFKKK